MPALDVQLALSCRADAACDELGRCYGQALEQAGYDRVAAGLSGVRYERSWYPGWMVVVMVLMFPLGLVLLAVKQTSEVAMQVVPTDFGCEVHIAAQGARPSRSLAAELTAGRPPASMKPLPLPV